MRTVKVLDPRNCPVVLALTGVQLDPDPSSRGEVCAADKPDDPREVAGPDLDTLPHHHPVLVLAVPLRVLVDVWLRAAAGAEDWRLLVRLVRVEQEV